MTTEEAIRELAGMYRVAVVDSLDATMEAERKNMALDMAIAMLENSEELVPVVRCAECMWWNPPKVSITGECAVAHTHTTGNFYCQAGQRKEEE